MLTHFETRLADLLGAALPAPFGGRVDVAPGAGPGGQPSITVAVAEVRRLAADFNSVRPEAAPGADDPRRVVRLDCDVAITVAAASSAGRDQVVAGVDAVLYELDGPRFRTASTLESPADDPGFVLELLEVRGAALVADDEVSRVDLGVVGWFWPPDAPGITGEPIAEARVRTVAQPVDLAPWPVLLQAGGPPLALELTTSTVGTTVLDGDDVDVEAFGALVLRLVDGGGRPGAGALAGGAPGPADSRVVTVADGTATVEYTPPGTPATDHLVVALAHDDTGDGPAVGVELARFSLTVAG